MQRSIVSTGLMRLINPFNHPKSPNWFYCWRYRVPMITPLFPAFPKKTNPIESQWNRESFPLHCIAFFCMTLVIFSHDSLLHSPNIFPVNITIFPCPLHILSSHDLSLHSGTPPSTSGAVPYAAMAPGPGRCWRPCRTSAWFPPGVATSLWWTLSCPGLKTQWGSAATRDT